MQDETKYETKYETLPIAEMTNGIILANYENTLSGYLEKTLLVFSRYPKSQNKQLESKFSE